MSCTCLCVLASVVPVQYFDNLCSSSCRVLACVLVQMSFHYRTLRICVLHRISRCIVVHVLVCAYKCRSMPVFRYALHGKKPVYMSCACVPACVVPELYFLCSFRTSQCTCRALAGVVLEPSFDMFFLNKPEYMSCAFVCACRCFQNHLLTCSFWISRSTCRVLLCVPVGVSRTIFWYVLSE